MSTLPTLSPQQFVAKWRQATLKARSAAQEHCIDLCRLIGHPTPADADPAGATFTFAAGAGKQRGGSGWADVWQRGSRMTLDDLLQPTVFLKPEWCLCGTSVPLALAEPR